MLQTNVESLKKHPTSQDNVLKMFRIVVSLVERDRDLFAKVGFDFADIEAVENKIAQLNKIATDEEFEQMAAKTIAKKNALMVEMQNVYKPLSVVCSQFDEKNSHKMTVSVYTYKNQASLLESIYYQRRYVKSHIVDFEQHGMTNKMFSDFDKLSQNFADVLEHLKKLKELRTTLRKERNYLLDIIFTEIVYICSIGKGIWDSKDHQKYQEYKYTRYIYSKTTK